MLHSLRLIAEMQFRVLCRLCACLVYRLSRFGVLSTWRCFRLIGVSRATTSLAKCGRTFYIPTKAKRELLVSDFLSFTFFFRSSSVEVFLFALTMKKVYAHDKKGLLSW